MASAHINEPIITINAMVQVGPWIIGPVNHGEWRHCDRCDTWHKEVWTCTIAPEVDDSVVAERLDNKRVWLIGSDCGPQLELADAAAWEGDTKDLKKRVKLAIKAIHVIRRAEATGQSHLYLQWVVGNMDALLRGTLTEHQQRVLGSHVSTVKNALDARERRQRDEAEYAIYRAAASAASLSPLAGTDIPR
jgi:hypothetical protein